MKKMTMRTTKTTSAAETLDFLDLFAGEGE